LVNYYRDKDNKRFIIKQYNVSNRNKPVSVETSWGAYKVKADELIIYVRMNDGEFYTIKGKRDYSN